MSVQYVVVARHRDGLEMRETYVFTPHNSFFEAQQALLAWLDSFVDGLPNERNYSHEIALTKLVSVGDIYALSFGSPNTALLCTIQYWFEGELIIYP